MPDNITVRCKLEAKRTDPLGYTTYVFHISGNDYIMCTRYPNWQHQAINIGDEGFLEYEEVVAGQEYFCPRDQQKKKYQYSRVQFIKFVPIAKAKKEMAIGFQKMPFKRKIPLLIEQDNEL